MSTTNTIVLLHGAFQNGLSTWRKVRPLLEAAGHKVIVVNLPGRDNDGVDLHTLTADIYRDAVLGVISQEPGPVVLVGHSFGGITITNVAEAAPEKIKALVYLSAYLPKSGESLMSLASTDGDSNFAVPGNLVLAPDYSFASILDSVKADTFANDAAGEDREAIVSSLISEAAGPQGAAVVTTDERFGTVPRFYIQTTQDHCVSPALQERMFTATPVQQVIRIDAGHASYITQPRAVADAILVAAAA
jgi:pimeloyl-ACP methyl ester carboxylesterase